MRQINSKSDEDWKNHKNYLPYKTSADAIISPFSWSLILPMELENYANCSAWPLQSLQCYNSLLNAILKICGHLDCTLFPNQFWIWYRNRMHYTFNQKPHSSIISSLDLLKPSHDGVNRWIPGKWIYLSGRNKFRSCTTPTLSEVYLSVGPVSGTSYLQDRWYTSDKHNFYHGAITHEDPPSPEK